MSLLVGKPQCGFLLRGKLYNKFVCQHECTGLQEPPGNSVAKYCNCSDKKLCTPFAHQDTQARSICRIEDSLYGCGHGKLPWHELAKHWTMCAAYPEGREV